MLAEWIRQPIASVATINGTTWNQLGTRFHGVARRSAATIVVKTSAAMYHPGRSGPLGIRTLSKARTCRPPKSIMPSRGRRERIDPASVVTELTRRW